MPQPPEYVITPERGSLHYWREVWQYRELFWFLSQRDLLVRYKQTVIGIAWSVLRPLLTMAVFAFVFGRLARLPSEGVPYPLFVLAALIPWQMFANALTDSSASLINNSNLLTKVYFPRVIMPASALVAAFVDGAVSFVLLAALGLWYGVPPGWQLFALPLFVALGAACSFGLGLWFAALNARYRDFRYIIPFVVQISLYVSPIGFSSAIVPEQWRLLYALNPLVGIVDGFRWALLGGQTVLDWRAVAASVVVTTALLALGTRWFRATERILADVI